MLLSNSTSPQGYLAHALSAIAETAAGATKGLFVPFAGVTRDWDQYTAIVRGILEQQGISVSSVHRAVDPARAVRESQLLLVGGGNTFHLLHHCRSLGLLALLRAAVLAGTPYVGWSAGSNLACPTIRTTNDMPIIDPQGLDALGLIPYQLNPHFSTVLPAGYSGEDRMQRLAEFTRLWPAVPVLGLPEGDWVRVRGAAHSLEGPYPAWWFAGENMPRSITPGPIALAR